MTRLIKQVNLTNKALSIPGSPANYWLLTTDDVINQRCGLSVADLRVNVFRQPHAAVQGTVNEIIHEVDGDTHLWLLLDESSKDKLACEFTPQAKLSLPSVGDHITVYGLWRWDDQHGWFEIHPVDYWEKS